MAAERKKELDEMGVDPNVLAEEHQKKVRLPQFYKFPRWSVMNEAEHKKYLAALLHQQMKGEFKFKENKTWIEVSTKLKVFI